jgi:hypothetical protein
MKNNIYLNITLGLLLAWLAYHNFNKYFTSTGNENTVSVLLSGDIESVLKRRQVEFDTSLRDPFVIDQVDNKDNNKASSIKIRPTAKSTITVNEAVELPFRLDGIMWNTNNPVAVLVDVKSGQSFIVKQGQIQNGVTVKSISRSEVCVLFFGKEFRLK